MVLQFDVDADLIDVPQRVVDNMNQLQSQFTTWLYRKENNHKYWITTRDRSGNLFRGVMYRGDAFVEWLNRKVLRDDEQKAQILETCISNYSAELPTLFF